MRVGVTCVCETCVRRVDLSDAADSLPVRHTSACPGPRAAGGARAAAREGEGSSRERVSRARERRATCHPLRARLHLFAAAGPGCGHLAVSRLDVEYPMRYEQYERHVTVPL